MGNQLDTDLRPEPGKFDFGGVFHEQRTPKQRLYTPAVTNAENHYEISPGMPMVFRCNFQPFSNYTARVEVQRQQSVTPFIDQQIRDYVDGHVIFEMRYEMFASNDYREGVPFEANVRIVADGHRKTIGGTFVIKE